MSSSLKFFGQVWDQFAGHIFAMTQKLKPIALLTFECLEIKAWGIGKTFYEIAIHFCPFWMSAAQKKNQKNQLVIKWNFQNIEEIE